MGCDPAKPTDLPGRLRSILEVEAPLGDGSHSSPQPQTLFLSDSLQCCHIYICERDAVKNCICLVRLKQVMSVRAR